MNQLTTWAASHPEAVVTAIVYVLYNLAKRWSEPDPTKHPVLHALWVLTEWVCVTAYDKFGGPMKLPFTLPKSSRE